MPGTSTPESVETIRRRVVVHGRVQGVFFRDSSQTIAQELGVGGWVRNLSDGTVELVAEGRRRDVDSLVEWCRQGPPRAHVSRIDVTAEAPAGEQRFRVRSSR